MIKWYYFRDVPRIWRGRVGGEDIFFFRFLNLHVASLGGFGGMFPRENIFKWCNLVRFGEYLDQILSLKFFFKLLFFSSFVRPSVEIISFRGNLLPNRPIELKIGLNVREGVVHVRKA